MKFHAKRGGTTSRWSGEVVLEVPAEDGGGFFQSQLAYKGESWEYSPVFFHPDEGWEELSPHQCGLSDKIASNLLEAIKMKDVNETCWRPKNFIPVATRGCRTQNKYDGRWYCRQEVLGVTPYGESLFLVDRVYPREQYDGVEKGPVEGNKVAWERAASFFWRQRWGK